VVTAGLSTGVSALLVPAMLHAAGISPGQTGLAFAAAGIVFAVGSALTAAVGRRAINLPVTCVGMLVLAAALSLAVVGTTPLLLVAMLCVTTAARSVLWTVSYPLAAGNGAGAGLGASVGLLNLIWAATAVFGPLGAGLAAEHFGAPAAFGLTQAACVAALAVTAALMWRARDASGSSPTPHPDRIRSRSARPS
jgi:MFS family permease